MKSRKVLKLFAVLLTLSILTSCSNLNNEVDTNKALTETSKVLLPEVIESEVLETKVEEPTIRTQKENETEMFISETEEPRVIFSEPPPEEEYFEQEEIVVTTAAPVYETELETTSQTSNSDFTLISSNESKLEIEPAVSKETTVTSILPKIQEETSFKELPESIMYELEYWQSVYPNMQIGVGLYSLDGKKGYEYNAYFPMNTACTIKATYALYVLKKCEYENIDIWSTYLTYESRHDDCGSGNIFIYGYHGQEYSIAELLQLLLGVSDNVAFNMLLEKFPLNDFYSSNIALGGENDWQKWGQASVQQRKNEWVAIYDYVNSGSMYSSVLRDYLTGTQYAYLLQGMTRWHDYMQKSGWTEETFVYPAAADCAIIDDSYILIVITQDYSFGSGHVDAIQGIGNSVESFWDLQGGNIF